MQNRWISSDPISAAVLLQPDIVQSSSLQHASVELHGTITRGATIVDYRNKQNREPNILLVENIDVDKYKQLLVYALGSSGNS